MEGQVENAILTAFDPYSPQNHKSEAFDFLNQLRTNPQGWPTCLGLALRVPKTQEIVRHACLEAVINAIASGMVDDQGMVYVKDILMAYIRKVYWEGSVDPDTYAVENKVIQLLTFMFARLYKTHWQNFVEELLGLCTAGPAKSAGEHRATRLYLKTLSSIHDEIGDTLVIRSPDAQSRANELKDILRERDFDRIIHSWMSMLPIWYERGRDIFNECLAVIGKWATWNDLSLIITDEFLRIIISTIMAAADADAAEEAVPASNAMLEILAKKMKPDDKLKLLDIFKVYEIIVSISNLPRLQDRTSSEYDTDLAELAAKILNSIMLELVLIADSRDAGAGVPSRANDQMRMLLPYLLRYFSDDFDEVCSTVIPALTDLLALVRKRADQSAEWIPMLPAILQAVISKMKYDDTSDWGSTDARTEEAEFQELRKRLETLQQTIAHIDETTYIQTISSVVNNAFETYYSSQVSINWRVLDLALHEMFIFGHVAQRNGALYNKNRPVTAAAEALIDMLFKMVQSEIANFSHPAIQLQYMELCVRYFAFFDNNPQLIPQALENFARFIHHDHAKVRQRSWYLFFRFTKFLKPHVSSVATTVLQSIGPLLAIKAEAPKDSEDDDDTSEANEPNADAKFQSQLYLYEAVGSISSANGVQLQDQIAFVRAVTEPQFTDITAQIPLASNGDERAVSQIHHIISALGTLAHGFVDSTPSSVKKSAPVAPEVSAEFVKVAEVILVALDSLNSSVQIRDAARTAFARLLGVLGTNILPQLPRWLGGLLIAGSSKDEIASFLRLIGQVIFAFSTEVQSFLNEIFATLIQRVFSGISEPTNGTDDEIQLVELKTHYLSFLLVVLSQGLGSVMVSSENQGHFENIITSVEHFTKDADDLLSAKIAFQLLAKMSDVWGGPDVPLAPANPVRPSPSLPGFDAFMQDRFSRLAWALPSEPSFDPKDAKSRQVLMEAAVMQKQILAKNGSQYLEWLRTQELPSLGMDQMTTQEYINNLATNDAKTFKQYFVKLTQSIKQ